MPSPRRPTAALRARLAPQPLLRRAAALGLRGRLRLRATRLLLAGGALVACALGLAAGLNLSHALSPAAFAAMAGEGFGRPWAVQSVRLELHRGPRLRLEGVEIEGLGSATAAEVELRLRPLLSGQIRARTVRLEAPHLTLRRGPSGAFLPLFRRTGGGDLSDLPAFEADGGEIDLVQGEKLTAVVRLSSLSLGRFDDGKTAELVVAGNLTGGDGRWHTHPIQLRGDLVHAPDHLALVEGHASARHVGARWWSGHDARARFAVRDGRVEIQSLDVRGFGGTWHASGRIWLRDGMRLELALHVEGVDFASLLSAADGRSPRTDDDLGTLRMHWDRLQVPWRGGPRFEEGDGQGQLRVLGGRLPGTSLLAALVGREPAPTPVQSFTALARLEGGRLHSDSVRLVTGDYTLEGRGSVGLDGSVALEGRLDLAGDLLVPTVPVTIAGTLPHPTVDTHVGRVPAKGVGAMAGAVHKTGSAVVRGTKHAGRKLGTILGVTGRKLGARAETNEGDGSIP